MRNGIDWFSVIRHIHPLCCYLSIPIKKNCIFNTWIDFIYSAGFLVDRRRNQNHSNFLQVIFFLFIFWVDWSFSACLATPSNSIILLFHCFQLRWQKLSAIHQLFIIIDLSVKSNRKKRKASKQPIGVRILKWTLIILFCALMIKAIVVLAIRYYQYATKH